MPDVRNLARRIVARMEPIVFFGSAAVVVATVAFGAIASGPARAAFGAAQSTVVAELGWFYVVTATALLVFAIWLVFSRYGSIRLGGDDARPEFGFLAWFTMLFAAGMGTGLVFWGVAEPIAHYVTPPRGEGRSPDAAVTALQLAFFHWGLHPWAIYSVFGLGLAYLHFRYRLPLAPRTLLYPLLGERIRGPIGHVVDIAATVGTLFGVATSLGLGAMQINSGLADLAGVSRSRTVQVAIIAAITAVATTSVVIGLRRGIRRLSLFNIGLAAALLVFVLVAGPTIAIVETMVTALGRYLGRLPEQSLWIAPGAGRWQAEWTLFYWSWWISWSPFVGVFTARISFGRTVREYVASVLVAPTAGTFLWLSVFGGAGLHVERLRGGLAEIANTSPELALHALLDHLPAAEIVSAAATLLVAVFFITSSDSGSLVDDMVTSGGHPNPPRAQRVFWAVAEGAVAAVLLLAGGLTALRTASLTSGLPMAVLLLVSCIGVVKALRIDRGTRGPPDPGALARRARDRPGQPSEEGSDGTPESATSAGSPGMR